MKNKISSKKRNDLLDRIVICLIFFAVNPTAKGYNFQNGHITKNNKKLCKKTYQFDRKHGAKLTANKSNYAKQNIR